MPEQPRAPTAPLDEAVETGRAPVGPTGLEPTPAIGHIVAIEADDERSKKKTFGIGAWIASAWLIAIVGAALLAPILPISKASERFSNLARRGLGSNGHLLGGDSIGHDLFSRLICGARNSLTVGVAAVAIGVLLVGA